MTFEKESTFARVIEDHLDLKRQNAELEPAMPIDRYRVGDPFQNHPLFKTEEQARMEETMDGVEPDFVAHSSTSTSTVANLPWPGEATAENASAPAGAIEDSGFWKVDRARDFDWGD